MLVFVSWEEDQAASVSLIDSSSHTPVKPRTSRMTAKKEANAFLRRIILTNIAHRDEQTDPQDAPVSDIERYGTAKDSVSGQQRRTEDTSAEERLIAASSSCRERGT